MKFCSRVEWDWDFTSCMVPDSYASAYVSHSHKYKAKVKIVSQRE